MKRLLPILLVAVVAFVGCSRRTLDMPSASMEPTIPAGSRVTIDFDAYSSAAPARFDIVAFQPPSPPNAVFVFRVIGLPGESVQITPQAVLINGQKVIPPDGLTYMPAQSQINQANLTATQFFLLGDNPTNARDCRFFGPVGRSSILGKVIRIVP